MTVLAFRRPARPAAVKPSDEASVALAVTGDLAAFEDLYRLHAGWVYGLCFRLTGQRELAEDSTQECFVAAWRSLPEFRGESRFSTWLRRIAINVVLSRRRSLQRFEATSVEELPDGGAGIAGEIDAAGPIDTERAIAALPAGARDVLVLVGIYGYSHEEASDLLGIAVGTSKAQLHRARALLAVRLGLPAEQL